MKTEFCSSSAQRLPHLALVLWCLATAPGLPGLRADAILLTDDRSLTASGNAEAAWGIRGYFLEPPGEDIILSWQQVGFSQAAHVPGLGGPWYGEVVGYTVAGDGSDSECLGESRVEAWGWQRSAVEPTHFEARSELELLVATWRNSNADGELSSVFRVTFALPIAHRFDFSGGSDGVILLAQIGGDKILQLGNAQRPETGWLEPGSYMLESTIRAHNGERQFAFQFDLTPAPVPETGSTVTALLLGLALLSAGKRRIRPSATRR